MWIEARGVSPIRALIDVSRALGFLSPEDYHWLLRETDESDGRRQMQAAVDAGALVLSEERCAYGQLRAGQGDVRRFPAVLATDSLPVLVQQGQAFPRARMRAVPAVGLLPVPGGSVRLSTVLGFSSHVLIPQQLVLCGAALTHSCRRPILSRPSATPATCSHGSPPMPISPANACPRELRVRLLHNFATFILIACPGLLSICAERQAKSAEQGSVPNIILILADDLGYADVACYGGKIRTPHIDRLAAEGMRFTDAHTASSVCTPTRYSLLTGRYSWRSRLKQGVLGGLSPRLIEPGRMTVASLLQEQGYRTACIGKWHLGMDWVVKPGAGVSRLEIEPRAQVFNVDFAQPIANGPNSVGFDYYFGISASLDMVPYTFIENDRVTSLPTEDRDFPMMLGREAGGRTRKGPAAPGFDTSDVLPVIVRKSCEFLDRCAEAPGSDKPFFLYVPFASPHTPILPTASWQGKSGMNPYADFVMETDAAVGEIMAALDRHELTEQTLVIFTSDNGCSPQAKFDELAAHGHLPSGPLRGHKADLFEGGLRVPLVVRWPERVAPGTVSPEIVCQVDIMATLAEILNLPLPPDAGEDSISFLPVLRGAKGSRDHLVSHSINGSFAVRRGDWKLLLSADSGGWSEPRPGSRQAAGLPLLQLYHLGDDLGEQHNVWEQHPERVGDLITLLERIVADGRSTPGEKQPNDGPVDLRARMKVTR